MPYKMRLCPSIVFFMGKYPGGVIRTECALYFIDRPVREDVKNALRDYAFEYSISEKWCNTMCEVVDSVLDFEPVEPEIVEVNGDVYTLYFDYEPIWVSG